MRKLLVAGDTHGNPDHLLYLYETAFNAEADAIFQVGDFGYWEHAPGGDAFLEMASSLACDNDLPIFWIDGNHENHTWLRNIYGPGGERHEMTAEGFWTIRPGVYYVPRGTRWVWSGKHLMGLGGAYSVDKLYRLKTTNERITEWMLENPGKDVPLARFQSWWPDEELDDEDVKRALADPTPLDVLFTHDKPRAVDPPWNRKALDECLPNQDRIQTVVRTLTPKLLVHGHLHLRYTQQIRCADDKHTTVVGLNCDVDPNDKRSRDRDPSDSWVMLDLAS